MLLVKILDATVKIKYCNFILYIALHCILLSRSYFTVVIFFLLNMYQQCFTVFLNLTEFPEDEWLFELLSPLQTSSAKI